MIVWEHATRRNVGNLWWYFRFSWLWEGRVLLSFSEWQRCWVSCDMTEDPPGMLTVLWCHIKPQKWNLYHDQQTDMVISPQLHVCRGVPLGICANKGQRSISLVLQALPLICLVGNFEAISLTVLGLTLQACWTFLNKTGICLSPFPQHWKYSCMLPFLGFAWILRFIHRSSCLSSNCFPGWILSRASPLDFYLWENVFLRNFLLQNQTFIFI